MVECYKTLKKKFNYYEKDSPIFEKYVHGFSKGSLNSSDMPVRKIVDLSLRHNAKTAFIAHNHPSGTALPSGSDLDTTIVLKSTLATVGVELIDHFIITDDDYVSLRESRLAGNIFYYEK